MTRPVSASQRPENMLSPFGDDSAAAPSRYEDQSAGISSPRRLVVAHTSSIPVLKGWPLETEILHHPAILLTPPRTHLDRSRRWGGGGWRGGAAPPSLGSRHPTSESYTYRVRVSLLACIADASSICLLFYVYSDKRFRAIPTGGIKAPKDANRWCPEVKSTSFSNPHD
jgi:hypothetical protein